MGQRGKDTNQLKEKDISPDPWSAEAPIPAFRRTCITGVAKAPQQMLAIPSTGCPVTKRAMRLSRSR